MTLAELREKLARLLTQARAKLDEITDDMDESRVAELEAEHDKIMAERDALEAKYEREKRIADAEARAEEMLDDRAARGADTDGGQSGGDGERMTYRQAFQEYCQARGMEGSMSEEARNVLRGGYGSIPAEERAQTTTNAAGGYTVPETMLERIVETMLAWGPMYEDGPWTVIPTEGGNAMPFPTVDDTANTGAAHTEGATLTDDGGADIVFGTKQLDAYAFDTEWLRISKELADDSFAAMDAFVGRKLGERLARLANAQLTTGSGSSAPHGIVTASSQGHVAAATNAITFDEIIDLEFSVDLAYRRAAGPNQGFMMHDTTLKAVKKLKDGDGNYLWQEGNVRDGTPNTIDGHRYWLNNDMAELDSGVSSRVMIFGDMSYYYVRKVGDILIGAIQDKDFWPGFGMAGYIRFDGELSETGAVKHLALAAS